MRRDAQIIFRTPHRLKRFIEERAYALRQTPADLWNEIGTQYMKSCHLERVSVKEAQKQLIDFEQEMEKQKAALAAKVLLAQQEADSQRQELEAAALVRERAELDNLRCEGRNCSTVVRVSKSNEFRLCEDCYNKQEHLFLAADKLKAQKKGEAASE